MVMCALGVCFSVCTHEHVLCEAASACLWGGCCGPVGFSSGVLAPRSQQPCGIPWCSATVVMDEHMVLYPDSLGSHGHRPCAGPGTQLPDQQKPPQLKAKPLGLALISKLRPGLQPLHPLNTPPHLYPEWGPRPLLTPRVISPQSLRASSEGWDGAATETSEGPPGMDPTLLSPCKV